MTEVKQTQHEENAPLTCFPNKHLAFFKVQDMLQYRLPYFKLLPEAKNIHI